MSSFWIMVHPELSIQWLYLNGDTTEVFLGQAFLYESMYNVIVIFLE